MNHFLPKFARVFSSEVGQGKEAEGNFFPLLFLREIPKFSVRSKKTAHWEGGWQKYLVGGRRFFCPASKTVSLENLSRILQHEISHNVFPIKFTTPLSVGICPFVFL